jgi:hypothetical protein
LHLCIRQQYATTRSSTCKSLSRSRLLRSTGKAFANTSHSTSRRYLCAIVSPTNLESHTTSRRHQSSLDHWKIQLAEQKIAIHNLKELCRNVLHDLRGQFSPARAPLCRMIKMLGGVTSIHDVIPLRGRAITSDSANLHSPRLPFS